MWKVSFLMLLAATSVLSAPELQLVHVVFSHKFYAPVETTNGTIFPGILDYQHFLEQAVDMDNKAKMDMFNLGVFLRQKYDPFLGKIYHPDFMQMRTTEYVLSMISGMLVNAGLWPPAEVQKWKQDLDWQPIPTEYEPAERDTLLMGYLCPTFKAEEEELNGNFSSVKAGHEEFFKYINSHYEKELKTPWEIAMLYSCLETIAAQNVTLPPWASHIFPNGEMENVTLAAYETLSKTRLQKTLNGGPLLKKILNDSLAHQNRNGTSKLKLLMYSGEDRNVMALLQNLGAWTPHILKQGASIIFEVHRDSNSPEYTIKMSYLTDVDSYKLVPLKLNDCGEYCPLTKFGSILKDILPTDEKFICHQKQVLPTQPPTSSPNDNSASRLSFVISVPAILMGLLLT
ncbi:venom acid phosphatase Acph-1 [Diachasma alloeum]|uniref:venom acid phosphatase Acph-1 n=1 Tax=Diachasma alloeum TaxID=454923 RepID=UPI0007381FF5|nr:venom acid phosphatase Acph-1 [Diachasma alloeum]